MIDRLTTAPKNQFNEFELFEGDIDYLVNRVTSSLLGDVPTKHSTKSGVLTQMGIDLGQCSNKLYYYHLQNDTYINVITYVVTIQIYEYYIYFKCIYSKNNQVQ